MRSALAFVLPGLLLAAPLSSAFVSPASADFRVATVDVNRVLNESKTSKSKRKEIDDMTAAARKKLEGKRASLKATEEKLKAGGVKEDSKEAEQFRSQAKDFARQVKDSEDEIKREFLKVNKVLTETTMKAISNFAERNDIDLVLDRGEGGRSTVLYGSSSFDITDSIIKQLNG